MSKVKIGLSLVVLSGWLATKVHKKLYIYINPKRLTKSGRIRYNISRKYIIYARVRETLRRLGINDIKKFFNLAGEKL